MATIPWWCCGWATVVTISHSWAAIFTFLMIARKFFYPFPFICRRNKCAARTIRWYIVGIIPIFRKFFSDVSISYRSRSFPISIFFRNIVSVETCIFHIFRYLYFSDISISISYWSKLDFTIFFRYIDIVSVEPCIFPYVCDIDNYRNIDIDYRKMAFFLYHYSKTSFEVSIPILLEFSLDLRQFFKNLIFLNNIFNILKQWTISKKTSSRLENNRTRALKVPLITTRLDMVGICKYVLYVGWCNIRLTAATAAAARSRPPPTTAEQQQLFLQFPFSQTDERRRRGENLVKVGTLEIAFSLLF